MKHLFLLALTSLIFVSCQKEISLETTTGGGGTGGGPGGGGSSGSYLQVKINGNARTFNFNNMAKITDFGTGFKALSLIGSATSSPTNLEGLNLTINFFSGGPAVGTYSEDSSGTNYVAAGVYNPNSTTIVYGAGIVYPTVDPLSITITKLNSTEATGTFKGAFYKQDITNGTPSAEYLQFTEGSFKLPIR